MAAVKLWILMLAAGLLQVSAVKVLLLPMNMGSHLLFFGQVASGLAETGHEATLYVPSNNKPPQGMSSKVNVISYKVPGDIPYGNSKECAAIEIAILNAQSSLEWTQLNIELQAKSFEHWDADCESLLESAADFDELSSAGYDLAIVDGVSYNCMLTIPYKLGIPYITLSVPYGLWGYRVAHLSSYYPNVGSSYGSRMNFMERVGAFSIDVMEHLFINDTDYFVRKHAPEKPVVGSTDLLFNSSMWWHLYDLAVGYPKATMPNTLDIGDIMVRPAKPLAAHFMDIMQASEYGVILVSLGSHFDAVPDEWLQEFCKAFNELKYTVIWKLKVQPPCQVASHVHVIPWTPQNDLLAHPKLMLFVTHCGYNSLIESVSHGKPMVGFPISLDQPYNALILKDKGMAEILDLKTFTASELITAVDKVLNDPSYRRNVQRASKFLRNKVVKPAERVSFWASHVVEYGDAHMVSAAKELNILQFLMIDIYALVFVAMLCSIMIVIVCICCTCKLMKRCFGCRAKKAHKD